MPENLSSIIHAGIVGCGAISDVYLANLKRFSTILRVTHCADIDPERAAGKARMHCIAGCSDYAALLADPAIDIIINLTVPLVHAEVSIQALEAGKHVYSEKPLAATYADASRIMIEAAARNLRVGCAPDTFLGASHQAARAAIDDGIIGQVIGGCAFMLTPGVENWHPNPEFFYKPGGGPLFDMGPYYITALVNMLGPVRRVCASAHTPRSQRTITSKPKAGQVIDVEVATHVVAILDFVSGAAITLVTSFDVQSSGLPNIELFGTTGNLQVPDPNNFGGNLLVRPAGARRWKKLRYPGRPYSDNSRGVGLADMASAISKSRHHRASGGLALHVVEVMEAILYSSEKGQHISITSQPARPEPLSSGLKNWQID